jgi:CubicO group peptidase (beta-lactamase class C family)
MFAASTQFLKLDPPMPTKRLLCAVPLAALCLVMGTLAVRCPAAEFPGEKWQRATPAEAGLDEAKLNTARDYALSGGGSGYIVRGGKLVLAWGDEAQRYDLKSTTKSFGAAALGLAIKDGKLKLSDKARDHHPTFGTPPDSNAATGWLDDITILHLASQTAGFDKPGGYVPLLFKPGTEWAYSDSGPNWLAECITLAYRRDLNDLMFERLFTPIGIQPADLVWRKNAYRPELIDGIKRREFGAGISANVDAMARFGLLWLRGGEWNGQQILPRDFIDRARTITPGVPGLKVHVPEHYSQASNHYGLLWWTNADGTIKELPRDTYWTWGLYDSLIVVMPSLDIVVARAGKSWQRTEGAEHYEVLKPFLLPIVAAAGANNGTQVGLRDGRWTINGQLTNVGSAAEGLLMNVRMVNATFEDRSKPDFDAEANTGEFIARLADYRSQGVNAFTLCLQGGMPGYEGAVNSAFNADGSLRPEYLARVERVIRACDQQGMAVILGLYYQRQSKILKDEAAVRAGVVNAARWIQSSGFRNVLVEVANEYPHKGFAHQVIRNPKGQAELIKLVKKTAPDLLVTASGYGDGLIHPDVAEACDFLTPHWNGTTVELIADRLKVLKKFGKPIVVNEDDKTGETAASALRATVAGGAGYGLMLQKHNQHEPFHFDGAADDAAFYAALKAITSPLGGQDGG